MKQKIYQQEGFLVTFIVALLVISISLITEHSQSLFVHETGNIRYFGSFGIILSIGLLLKWRYARIILGFLTLLALIITILILVKTEQEFLLAYTILTIALLFASYLLWFSKALKIYTDDNNSFKYTNINN